MEGIVNNLIESIGELNVEESIYWAHLLKQQKENNLDVLNELFKGFSLGSEELSFLLSSLIWDILKNEDFPVIYEKYRKGLNEGLLSNDESVLKLCLRIIFELGIQKSHEIDGELIKVALNLLLSSNYSVSSYLIEILPSFENENISKEIIDLYSSLSTADTVIKFRFFELFSKSNSFDKTFLDEIKSIISSPNEDPLMTVNIIQIIQDCIDRKEQFDLFSKEGIIDLLLSVIDNENSIISCKVIELLANCSISKCFAYEFVESNELDRKLLLICEENETKKVSSVFCLAAFACLSEDPHQILLTFDNFLFHEISSVQLSALNGLGIYFKSESEANFKFNFLLHLNSKGFFQWLIEKINSTFIEEKSSAYFTLKSIICLKENFKFILDNTTILSILLQRNLDDSPIGLKWKYGILEQIYGNTDLFDCLNDPLKEQVKKYLGQGVTFVPKSSRVAFEAE